jgi:hypothetical protein
MSLPQYQYSPLGRKGLWPIRLLKLHAGTPESVLSCNLEHTTLDQSPLPNFDALSYVWGSPEGEKTSIYVCEGNMVYTIQILPSLRAALCRLRQTTENRAIWIDALCINQSDHAERSQQVPMMGHIYRRARSVGIWLGEAAEESDVAFDFIPRIIDLSQFDQIIKDQSSTHQWYALSRLMNRSWFSRRWVVQELAFAKEARLYCGNKEVDWASFADAATLFAERQQDIVKLFWMSPEYAHDAEIFGDVQALGALRLIEALNRLFRRSEDGEILEGLVNLETLVTSLNVFETKDPRDCIYAVMHLAEDAEDIATGTRQDFQQKTVVEASYPTLPVDYRLPFDEIARGFVAFCIKSSTSLDIICRPWAPIPHYYSSTNGPFSSQQILSSWMCTLDDSVFEIREDGHHVRKRGDSFVGLPGRPIYQASKGFPSITFDYIPGNPRQDSSSYLEMARFPVDATLSFKAPRMEVKGLRIGSIQALGERAMEGTIPFGWFLEAGWPQRRSPMPEAFYRTLVADRSANGGNPPSWYKRALEYALTNSGTGDVRLQRMINQSRSTVTAELLRRVQSAIWNRRLVITDRGAFGLVPEKAQIGDEIMVLYGASVPVILRRLVSSYWLVGECYIHGAMDGLKSTFNAGASGGSSDSTSGGPRIPVFEIVSLR